MPSTPHPIPPTTPSPYTPPTAQTARRALVNIDLTSGIPRAFRRLSHLHTLKIEECRVPGPLPTPELLPVSLKTLKLRISGFKGDAACRGRLDGALAFARCGRPVAPSPLRPALCCTLALHRPSSSWGLGQAHGPPPCAELCSRAEQERARSSPGCRHNGF